MEMKKKEAESQRRRLKTDEKSVLSDAHGIVIGDESSNSGEGISNLERHAGKREKRKRR